MAPTARRRPWSQAEDKLLLSIVQKQGANNWVRISQTVRTRTPKRCCERFHQNLKPSLNHLPITPEEGETIERLVAEMGKKWAKIAWQLNGRSDNAVKNWWNGGQTRRRRMSDKRRSEQQSAAAQQQQHQSRYRHNPSPIYTHRMNEQYLQQQQHPYHICPAPLTVQPHTYSTRAYDTSIPSPSDQSVSTDSAPSLITDNSSESRSPHYAPSPIGHPPPLTGRRDERRRSSLVYLPRNGSFATDDESQLSPFRTLSADHQDPVRKREHLRLPELPSFDDNNGNSSHILREPNYNAALRRQLPLLIQAFPDSSIASSWASPVEPSSGNHQHGHPSQQALPSFSELVQACSRRGHPAWDRRSRHRTCRP